MRYLVRGCIRASLSSLSSLGLIDHSQSLRIAVDLRNFHSYVISPLYPKRSGSGRRDLATPQSRKPFVHPVIMGSIATRSSQFEAEAVHRPGRRSMGRSAAPHTGALARLPCHSRRARPPARGGRRKGSERTGGGCSLLSGAFRTESRGCRRPCAPDPPFPHPSLPASWPPTRRLPSSDPQERPLTRFRVPGWIAFAQSPPRIGSSGLSRALTFPPPPQ